MTLGTDVLELEEKLDIIIDLLEQLNNKCVKEKMKKNEKK